MKTKLFLLLLVFASCSKPEPLQPTQDFKCGKYHATVIGQSGQLAYTITSQTWDGKNETVYFQDSTFIDLRTDKSDVLWFVLFSDSQVSFKVYRNDTVIYSLDRFAPDMAKVELIAY